jgi:acetylglutamate kinase
LAARLGARRLIIAGTTPGVLDASGRTITQLNRASMSQLLENRTATAGMIAKLRACDDALRDGVGDVVIVDGREPSALVASSGDAVPASATLIQA